MSRQRMIVYGVLAFVVLGLPALWSLFTGVRNAAGYCASEPWPLPADALIDAAIKQAIQDNTTACSASGEGEWPCSGIVKFASVDGFKSANPDCCVLGRSPDAPKPGLGNTVNWLQGEEAGEVTITFTQKLELSDGTQRSRPMDQLYRVSNCGLATPAL